MYKRILNLPLDAKHSIFLFGPRGTGKTSWIKSHLPNDIYLDLLDFTVYGELSKNPNHLEERIPHDYRGWVIIDEVQRIPELLNEVHRLIEHRKMRFILTGSSARTLRKRGINLLAGRARIYHMHPLTIQEIGDDFNLKHSLQYGLLPTAVLEKNPTLYLKSYVQAYLREEIVQEGITRHVEPFANFLTTASFSQGSVLNFSEIARELGMYRATIANYFTILEDLLIGVTLTPFLRRAKRKMVATQKFYFFDSGVYRIIRPTGPLDTKEESEGAELETLFLQSLRAINDYYQLDYKIHFWRTHNGDEVDFVIYGPNGFHAFEIKRSSSSASKQLQSLKLFHEDFPEAKLYLINLGKHREYHGPIKVIPFENALRELPKLISAE